LFPGVGCVHVQAHGAAIDLGRANLDQLHEAVAQAALMNGVAKIKPLLHQAGRRSERIQSPFHDHFPLLHS
jgi:hypothetical protein